MSWCTLTWQMMWCRGVHSPDMWRNVVMCNHLMCHVMVYTRTTGIVVSGVHPPAYNVMFGWILTWHVMWCLGEYSRDIMSSLYTLTWYVIWCPGAYSLGMSCRGIHSLERWCGIVYKHVIFNVGVYTHLTFDIHSHDRWCGVVYTHLTDDGMSWCIFTLQVMWCLGVHYLDMLCDVVVLDHVTCDVMSECTLNCHVIWFQGVHLIVKLLGCMLLGQKLLQDI